MNWYINSVMIVENKSVLCGRAAYFCTVVGLLSYAGIRYEIVSELLQGSFITL